MGLIIGNDEIILEIKLDASSFIENRIKEFKLFSLILSKVKLINELGGENFIEFNIKFDNNYFVNTGNELIVKLSFKFNWITNFLNFIRGSKN